MHPNLLEREIEHLEHVVPYISSNRDCIPLRYWQGRVDLLGESVSTEVLRLRVQALHKTLAALQSREVA